MSETVRRALRTLCQAAPAGMIVAALVAFHLVDAEQATALTAVLTVAFTVGYNTLEEAGVPVPVKRAPTQP